MCLVSPVDQGGRERGSTNVHEHVQTVNWAVSPVDRVGREQGSTNIHSS